MRRLHTSASRRANLRPGSGPRSAICAITALLALACTAGLAASAQAATYTVGTLSDLTGTCANPAAGTCSLRQLIEYENELPTTPSPSDTIIVPGGQYNLSGGALTITQSLSIVGAGARTANVNQPENSFPEERVFQIQVPKGGSVPSVTISGLEISGGVATEANGSFGGDVLNEGSLTLDEDWITKGKASSGGGISNNSGTLLLERSLVSANHASSGGGDSGAIQNHGTAICGTACFPGKKAILVVDNSTIAGNDARLGAGIFSWSDAADGNEVSIFNSTIVENTTKEETGGPARGPGAGLLISDGTAEVAGTIFAFNAEVNPNFVTSNCSTLGSGTIASLGYNLETGTECGFKSTGDLEETFPEFTSSEPQNNGGNTDTFALQTTSRAIDAIPTSFPFCNGADQRNVPRPQGVGCDIGAFELVPLTIKATEGAQLTGEVAVSPSCGIENRVPPTIEWGDGQTTEGTIDENGVSGSHTYAEEGTYYGSVTYVNDCGTHKVAFLAQVGDAPLTATGVPVTATAGVQLSATVATFTDADPAGTVADYTATIDWGDGTTSAGTIAPAPGGDFTVTGAHTYTTPGAYQTSVKVNDAGGATATATSTATVAASGSPAPPTVLATSPPTVLTTTSAAFTTTVNPHGLATTVHFEYGPVLPGAKAAAVTYESSTPDQPVGSDYQNHTVSATVTGLLPNITYNVRAVATNSEGSTLGTDETFNTPADPPPPPPVLGKTANVAPVSGLVLIELPPGATSSRSSAFSSELGSLSSAVELWPAVESLTKGLKFVPLTEARQIPVGSTLNTTGGVVSITTAITAAEKGKVQSGDFGAGIFKLLQDRKLRGLTELNILNAHSARQGCLTVGKKATTATKHLSGKVLGRLNASAHGKFTTRGQYSAATVRGTVWGVTNQCDGTLTKVKRGVVSVRDFRRRKTITLFTGQSYLARAPSF